MYLHFLMKKNLMSNLKLLGLGVWQTHPQTPLDLGSSNLCSDLISVKARAQLDKMKQQLHKFFTLSKFEPNGVFHTSKEPPWSGGLRSGLRLQIHSCLGTQKSQWISLQQLTFPNSLILGLQESFTHVQNPHGTRNSILEAEFLSGQNWGL